MRWAPALPFAGTQLPLALPAATCDGQKKQHGDISRAIGQHARRVGHHDALRLGGGDIDVIEADPEIAEDFRTDIPGKDRSRQLVRNGRQHRIIIRQRLTQFAFSKRYIISVERQVEALREHGLYRGRPASGDENAGFWHESGSSILCL